MIAPVGTPRRAWLGLAVLALPCVLYAMDLTVLDLAVPKLASTLHATGTELLWILDIYGFLVAGSLITMGALGDRIGRRRLLLIGAVAFGITSIVAAFATSAATLIVSRALLGLAGATLAPSTLSLIRNLFEQPRDRALAISVWIASYSAGSAIGPVVGGLVLEHLWPGSVFLLGVPVMALLLVLGPVLLPESKNPTPAPVDYRSALLSLVAILLVVWGMKRIATGGFSTPSALLVVGGVAVGAGFVRRQATLAEPLVDLRLFRVPAFSAALGAYALATFVVFGVYVGIAQYLQLVAGLSPLRAGVVTLPMSLAFIAGSLATPRLVQRVAPIRLIAVGLAVAALGLAVLARVGGQGGIFEVIVALVLFPLGLAPVFTLATDLVVSSAPAERAGVAAGLSETGSELGGALGIAVLGSVGAAVFRGELARTGPGAPGDSLTAALAFAETLPSGAREAVGAAAREAFAASLRFTATVAAVLVFVLALAAFAIALCAARASARLKKETNGNVIEQSMSVVAGGLDFKVFE